MTDHIPLADAIEDLIKERLRGLRIRTGAVSSEADGLVSLIRPGSTEPEGGYARLIPKAPAAGDRVAIAQVGGTALVLGVISAEEVEEVDLGAPTIGQVFARGAAASAASTTTNTSTSAYATALSATWSDIPDGTYDVVVMAGAAYSHSGSGNLHSRFTAGGSDGTEYSLSLTTSREQIRYTWNFSNIVVVGGLTVTMAYKLNGGSGTISARNPSMLAMLTFKGA
jgi:hypothetical protein